MTHIGLVGTDVMGAETLTINMVVRIVRARWLKGIILLVKLDEGTIKDKDFDPLSILVRLMKDAFPH